MKKRTRTLVSILLLITFVYSISSCTSQPTTITEGAIIDANQSEMSKEEVIYNAKQITLQSDYVPPKSHWQAIYKGKGVWLIGMWIDSANVEEDYPVDAREAIIERYGGVLASDYPYIYRYYERSNSLEYIIPDEATEIIEDYPKLIEGLLVKKGLR